MRTETRRSPGAAGVPAVEAGESRSGRDYWDPRWSLAGNDAVDLSEEPWLRFAPAMRVYGVAVLAIAFATGLPAVDGTSAWGRPLAALLGVALVVAFAFMWVRRPIWEYPTRLLLAHGALQLAAYAALVALAPQFAVLGLLVYPQVVFSLPLALAVGGGLFMGVWTGGAAVVRASPDPAAGLPSLGYNVLVAALVVVMAVWVRQTISQSMERRVLIAELAAARRDVADAERDAAVAEERARLSREIHDTLAQGFTSVVAHLEAADACLDGDPSRTREDLGAARDVARASLAEARTFVWALRPESIAAAGLPAAIERVAAAVRGPGGPAVEVEVSGVPRPLHPDVEVTLLRAAQEALGNARRHAAASRITVTLTYFADEVTLDVADDGSGFDPAGGAASGAGGGMGLRGMRERAERLRGSVAVESAPGEGTTVAVSLPAIEAAGPGADGAAADGADATREAAPVRPEGLVR